MLELIKSCQSKNPKGQRELYNSFYGRMFRVCFRYLPEKGEAEDALINGFVKIFENISKVEYRSEKEFIAWMKRIMVNECLMQIRKNKLLTSLDEAGDIAGNQDEEVESNLAAEELYNMLLQLPAGYRTVFNLYAIEGYSHSEIASQLDISEGTSKSQLSKARKLLQELIREKGGIYVK